MTNNKQETPPTIEGSRPFRTLIVDDSAVLREKLCDYFREQSRFEVVGTARDGIEALERAEALRPDFVLMDVRMPRLNGLEAAAILRRRLPGLRIILMSLDDTAALRSAAARQGAHGFIGKRQIITSHLMKEIGRVLRD